MTRPKVSRKAGVWTAAVLAVVGALAFVVIHFGVQVHRLDSGSMTGTLPQGSVVITYKTHHLEPRDIISFRNPEDKKGGVTTHTFLGYAKDGKLITHGDANPSIDNFDGVPYQEDVIGKVLWHVDVFTASFWKSWRGILLAVGLLGLLLVEWLLRSDRSSKSKPDNKVSQPA